MEKNEIIKNYNDMIKELSYDEIPCDYCRNMDCMNCKYVNGF